MNYLCLLYQKIQQYNSLISMINYLASLASLKMQTLINKQAHLIFNSSTTPANQIIQIVRWALNQDFTRYQSQIHAKIVSQEFNKQQLKAKLPPMRQYSKPLNLNEKKPHNSLSPFQSNQKTHSTINMISTKLQNAKTKVGQSLSVIPICMTEKQSEIFPSISLSSFKIKKQISKLKQVKRGQLNRIPKVNMIQTVQTGRINFNDRDIKRVRQRLQMRRVQTWNFNSELKRKRHLRRTKVK